MFGKKKVSIDFYDPCYQSMITAAKEKKSSNSNIINTLVEVFLQLSPTVRQDIGTYCQTRYTQEKVAADTLTGMEQKEREAYAEQYHKLSTYFGVKKTDAPPKTNKIFLKDGYVTFPDDWIILPDVYDRPDNCLYAGVVESRNCEKYHIPHFIFFCNYKYTSEYPADFTDTVYQRCAAVYPDFRRLYNMQLPTPDLSRTDPEGLEIMQKWYDAPQFSLFHIVEKDDPIYWNRVTPNYNPPYGVMIVRDN